MSKLDISLRISIDSCLEVTSGFLKVRTTLVLKITKSGLIVCNRNNDNYFNKISIGFKTICHIHKRMAYLGF